MASIRRRNSRYHVQIRKNGYQTLTHTLSSLSLARKWAAGVEADMEPRVQTSFFFAEFIHISNDYLPFIFSFML